MQIVEGLYALTLFIPCWSQSQDINGEQTSSYVPSNSYGNPSPLCFVAVTLLSCQRTFMDSLAHCVDSCWHRKFYQEFSYNIKLFFLNKNTTLWMLITSCIRGLWPFLRKHHIVIFLNENFIQSEMFTIYLVTKGSESLCQHVANITELDKEYL